MGDHHEVGSPLYKNPLIKCYKLNFRTRMIVPIHLQAPNHGKLFKSLMNAYLPGWENILAEQNGSAARNL